MRREAHVANGVDPTMEAMQSASDDSPGHGATRITELRDQLRERNHAVLPPGQLGQGAVATTRPLATDPLGRVR